MSDAVKNVSGAVLNKLDGILDALATGVESGNKVIVALVQGALNVESKSAAVLLEEIRGVKAEVKGAVSDTVNAVADEIPTP